jgi:phage gp36-like protein
MAYCTSADISLAISPAPFLQLADDDESGAVDSAVVDNAIATADAYIDAMISTRFSVPVSPVPDIIKFASVWLSVCQLGKRRGLLPEDYGAECEKWMRWLEDVKDGRVDIPGLTEIDTGLPESTSEDQQADIVKTRKDTSGGVLNSEQTPNIDLW